MAHRSSAISGLTSLKSRHSLYLRTTLSKSIYPHANQIRTLWWWRRHGKDWSSWLDEHAEERLRRHQKIMKYRYSKALRRRAMWDRDEPNNSSSSWQMSSRWFGGGQSEHLSTSSGERPETNHKVQETSEHQAHGPYKTFHKDFESFKAAVDRAIDRDPFGTLFGRRLQSPPTSNNSSWTSFSWIFDPKEIKDEDKLQHTDQQSSTEGTTKVNPESQRTGQVSNVSAAGSPIPSSGLTKPEKDATEEYEFDPISMRKVAKTSRQTEEPACGTPFLKMLFSEHGATIPVKTYKPHKVHGYGAEKEVPGKSTLATQDQTQSSKGIFESSRKRELKNLMAATLGNTIGTTAEYYGKYEEKDVATESMSTPKKTRDYSAPNDESPLFSGTTYDARTAKSTSSPSTKTNWLVQEGFATPEATPASSARNASESVEIPVKKFQPVETITESTRAVQEETDSSAKAQLQPSLDRQEARQSKENTNDPKASAIRNNREVGPADAKAEDIDLLRASDVRAATKSARLTSYDLEKTKEKQRETLEADYVFRQGEENKLTDAYVENSKPTTDKIASSLTAVWKHVREYPQGIVAKTMQSVGMFNDNFKKYTKPYDSSSESTEKLDFNDQNIQNVASIFKTPAKTAKKALNMTSSKEVLDAERVIKDRTASLRQAAIAEKKDQDLENSKATTLASELRQAYEGHYGPIDVHHRQQTDISESRQESNEAQEVYKPEAEHNNPHPLQSATVKPGVIQDPVIEYHTKMFEPKFAKIVDGAKEVRREAHEIKQKFKAIQSRRPSTYWQSEAKETAEGVVTATDAIDSGISQSSSQTGKLMDTNATAHQVVPEPVSNLGINQANSVKDDAKSNNDTSLPLTSEYVILSWNTSIGQVEMAQTTIRTDFKSTAAINPVQILARLKNASEFLKYFPSLEAGNYEMIDGGDSNVVFKRKADPGESKMQSDESIKQKISEQSSTLPDSKAIEFSQLSNAVAEPKVEAATVLDQLPTEIVPPPGPSAPTAPTPSSERKVPNNQPKVRRQEKVFSGTRRPIPSNTSSSGIYTDISHPTLSEPRSRHEKQTEEPFDTIELHESLWARFKRGTRRVVLTILALGGTAYAIGFVAEGLDARTQQKRGSLNSTPADFQPGPRKKIVMTGQRPGIYSTESSR